ncbi:hypothetical protein KUCAC02_011792 [Chaenocephalus aceratus]|uniref:Uncharacterized protein n=1 Tax=Chaenocephalus aceratus TaxID=36190 RepID=A0ACB9WY05_CHAAC|nr:hypothetical protein KUCAC02_011792 [Chaenocephalus aceratus]
MTSTSLWLGPYGWKSHSVAGEWPVSYHGTSSDGARGIIKTHYKAGDRALYGRGIYSTPDIHVADGDDVDDDDGSDDGSDDGGGDDHAGSDDVKLGKVYSLFSAVLKILY